VLEVLGCVRRDVDRAKMAAREGCAMFVGVDPGAKGFAVAIDYSGGRASFRESFAFGAADDADNLERFGLWVEDIRPFWARWTVEEQHARAGQGSQTRHILAEGSILGILWSLGRRPDRVHPATWVAAMGLRGTTKNDHRRAAMERVAGLPLLRSGLPAEGLADAALIALWAARR
jgi:hypothetical protein